MPIITPHLATSYRTVFFQASDSGNSPNNPTVTSTAETISIHSETRSQSLLSDSERQLKVEISKAYLIFAGISLEVCAALPAITAVGKGYDAYVAVDASGTFSETKRQTGLLRMLQAGVIVSDYATLMVEILKDNGRPEAGAVYDALDMPWAKLVGQITQAYGK